VLSAAGTLVSINASLEAMAGPVTHDPEAPMFARSSIFGLFAASDDEQNGTSVVFDDFVSSKIE
jgi:hypothetical protein